MKIRKAVIGLKPRPRRRYKKKKHDLILYLKIALICYLTIFGVGYMSSDTSAYLSSQVEFSETITAGEWVVPGIPVNACGEEYTIDEVLSKETDIKDEVNADSSIEKIEKDVVVGGEIEFDCGDQSAPSAGACSDEEYTNDEVVSEETDIKDEVNADSSIEEIEKDVVVGGEIEIDCSGQSDSSAGSCNDNEESLAGENQEDAGLSEGVNADCIDTGDESNEENDKAAEDVEIPGIEQEIQNQNELENGDIDSETEDDNKTDTDDNEVHGEQNPTDESQKQPDSKDETVTESEGINPTDQDSQTAETLEISID
ncbi:hypothetical protein [Solibacillus sp. CAU 1738]|uniref:hypothetical protein n=1 Tax=Solibacillus sp. CAU 1738 TaxID=3140363 RepID=UPI003261B24E